MPLPDIPKHGGVKGGGRGERERERERVLLTTKK
jgi:hypothetical protein